ncbi:ferritin [Candidatus Poribacteria bacterium]|nr:ferritin [Candidatus Poribacteria bacterium]
MIGQKMQDALNDQINAELFSYYIYLSMATCFHAGGWEGMAKWMEAQAKEEMGHAMKIYGHIVERGGRVMLKAIEQPQSDWDSALDAFKAAYEHEKYITGRINDLVDLAAEEDDKPAGIMLQWFVTEQVEEEASVSKIVEWLERIGDSGNGMIMLDVQLGKRE